MKLKRRIILSAVSVFCAAAVTVASLPYNAALAAATAVTTDYLNLRTGAGTDQKVILSLSKGVSITILDNSNPAWAKVKTASGLVGYCNKQFLNISGASSAAPTNGAKVASGTSAVTTSNLNLRSGAGSTNAIITTMSKGTTVKVIDSTNSSWYKVQTSDGKLGYCTSQFLQIAAPSTTQPPAQTGNSAAPTGNSSTPASSATAVAMDYVNLRQGAGTTYKVLQTVSKGVSLKVLDSSNNLWTKVQTPSGKQGYCSKQYLRFSNTSNTPPSSNTTSPTAGSPASSGTKVLIGTATSALNLRSGAGSKFSVIATLPKGTVVTVTDNSNNVWAKVKTSDGKQGYCSKSFLNVTSSTQQSTPPATTPTTPTNPAAVKTLIGTTTSGLNLRSGAGTSYKVIVCLAKGATVTVIDNSNSLWAKVKTADGKTGYCQKKYLNITEKTTPQTNTGSNTNTNTNTGAGTNTNTNTGTDSGSPTHTITGASVTADLLRLREQPNSSANVVTNLPKGTSLTVLDASNSEWTKVQTSSGQVGYVSSQYIKIHYSDDPEDTVTGSTGLLSASSCSIPQGKTLYIKASGSASVTWTSSDPSVATVSNGYVYAAAKGNAVITATNGTDTATCNITVTDAEPVKTAYASPNIASTGAEVTFIAVTDTTRDAVRFVITMQDGTTRTLDTTNYTEETAEQGTVSRKWTASTTFDTAGTYSFTALSSLNGVMSSSGFRTNAYVSNQQSFTTTTDEERRASDQMIALIGKWEGYRGTVYADTLTSNQVPTIGYGCTFGANAVFYNDMTQPEAWSLLVNKINNASYTTELNKMIKANNFQMSQNQADCLISFAYNVGAGYFNSTAEMDFRRIMKNAVIPPDFSAGSVQGTVTKDATIYDTASRSGNQLSSITSGTTVTVTKSEFADARDGWYGVTLADGSEGWINSGYINLANSDSLIHDLNYTNAYAFGTDLIRWNQAGGKFYTGLFYRRMGEVNVYNYGDYEAARYNKYGYTYPSSAAGLD